MHRFPKRLADIGTRFMLLAAGTILGLIGLELGVRIFEPELRDVVEAEFDRHAYRIHANPRDHVAWRHHPDSRERHPVIFNSLGLRQHRRFSPEKPIDTLRLGFFGDSFTANLRLPVERSFTEPLEFLLRRSEVDAEVLNFGTDGYGTDQSWLQYVDESPGLGLDLIYYVFCHNDLRDLLANELFELSKDGELRYRPRREERLWVGIARRFHLTYFLARRSAQLQDRLAPGGWDEGTILDADGEKANRRRLGKVLIAEASPERERAVALFRSLMVSFRDAAASQGQEFRVVLLPIHGRANRQVASILEELGIQAVDLFQSFYSTPSAAEAERAAFFFRTDGHWNAAGNRQAASILATSILRDLERPVPSRESLEEWLDTYDAAVEGSEPEDDVSIEIRSRYLALMPAEVEPAG